MRKYYNHKASPYKVGAIISYITLAVNSALGIFFTPFMIRKLGEGEYGLYQLIGAFAGYLSILDMGMSSAITKYVTKYYQKQETEEQENFLAVMIIYYAMISVIILIIAGIMFQYMGILFSNSLSDEELKKAKVMFVFLVFNVIVTLFGGVFRGVMNAYECFLQTKGAELARVILRVVMIIGILNVGGNSIGLVLIDTFLNICFFIYRMSFCFASINIKIRFHRINIHELKDVCFYAFFVFLNLIFDQLNWKIDHTILGIKLTTTAVTIYSIGMNFSNYFMNFSVAVKSLFLPKVMKLEVKGAGNNQFTDFLIKTGRLQGYLLFYLYLAFIFMGQQFIKLIMGKDYHEAWLSAILVMTGLIIPLLQNAGHPILQSKNKHHIYVIVCFFISLINALCTWFIVDKRGIVGAAFMTMLSLFVGQAVFLSWYYHKKIGMNMILFGKEIFKANILPLIGVLLFEIIWSYFFSSDTWLKFIIHGIIYSLIYFTSIFKIGMNQWEKNLLLSFLKK